MSKRNKKRNSETREIPCSNCDSESHTAYRVWWKAEDEKPKLSPPWAYAKYRGYCPNFGSFKVFSEKNGRFPPQFYKPRKGSY